ncbi:MAG: cell division protein ZapB [Thermoanaerobaculia bacterium]
MNANWLGELEDKVEAAAKELENLRKENRTIKARLKKLQRELLEVDGAREGADTWQRERQQVQRRLATLADSLEQLL